MIQANVIAMSGRAVEAAGDVDVLLLDKTGTITLGNRQATDFIPAEGVTEQALADAAQLASLADETPEGRSIVVLAKEKYGLRGRDIDQLGATFIAFTAQTRMSGVDLERAPDPQGRRRRRRGATWRSSVASYLPIGHGPWSTSIAKRGRHAAGRRRGRRGPGRRSSSRTSSRAASRSASPSCGRWASRRS